MSHCFFYHHAASWICKHLLALFPCSAASLLCADGDSFTFPPQCQLLLLPMPWQRGCSSCLPSATLLLPTDPIAVLPAPTVGRITSFSMKGLLN